MQLEITPDLIQLTNVDNHELEIRVAGVLMPFRAKSLNGPCDAEDLLAMRSTCARIVEQRMSELSNHLRMEIEGAVRRQQALGDLAEADQIDGLLDDEGPLTDEEKQALRRLGVDPDAPQMSDAEWHERVAAHNAVVYRKGLGVPLEEGEVEQELARRRVIAQLDAGRDSEPGEPMTPETFDGLRRRVRNTSADDDGGQG